MRRRRPDESSVAFLRARIPRWPRSFRRPALARARVLVGVPALVLVLGLAASAAAGIAWRGETLSQSRQDFRTRAASVGSAVTTQVQRMDDLTAAGRTLVASRPELTNAQLGWWYRSIDAGHRYPALLGFGFMEYVPASQLGDYVADIAADPVPDMRPPARFQIYPAGKRSAYCLIRLGVAAPLNGLIPNGYGFDLCAFPGSGSFVRSRDTGRFTTLVATLATGNHALVLSAPVYRSGADPGSVAARRASLLGWVTSIVDVDRLLHEATAGDHSLGIVLSRQTQPPLGGDVVGPSSTKTLSRIASVGRVPAHPSLARRFVVNADGKWIVTVTDMPTWGPFSPTVQAVALSLGGALVTVLLFVLVQVPRRGRARALRMVAEKTDELRHQALHDPLTGLPNRALIMDRMERMLVRARRSGTPAAALFLDLDSFKSVNDTFGHPTGDELLRAVADRLTSTVRESDTVGRFGGDEFVVLLEGQSLETEAELIAERLLDVLREPYEVVPANGPLPVTASIGVAFGERAGCDELLRDADIALYEAKSAGKNRAALFRREMQVAVHDRLELETELRAALAAGQLTLHYQPKLDLGDGAVKGVEALVRWQHPTRGLLLPRDFVPVAEETGLIVPIGAWVIEEACRQGGLWHRAGFPVDVSVNVSARQLDDDGLQAVIAGALAFSGFDPRSLILEVTESVLMRHPEATARRLEGLKSLGVRVAIDDFGTGYSSLAYLQRFPVDALKIDRTFVAGISHSREAKALIRTLVQLGKTLGLGTVAEGIEDAEQLDYLRTEGCERGQGFLFAHPLEPDAALAFLRRNRRLDHVASTGVAGLLLPAAPRRAAPEPSG
jgi:diguanylate cyclase (GGDEF)-like protein